MRIVDDYRLQDVETARAIVRAHPFATIVAPDLRATHMPCLLDEGAGGLAIVGHVARADPLSATLGGPLLVIFHGPHGYVSASWYEDDAISTWNYVMLHVHGTPELYDDPIAVLKRTVDHFESAVERPRSLGQMGEGVRAMADRVVAFRLTADSWYAEGKLSQDKPARERARVLDGLETPGPYANVPLAEAMRRLGGA